MVPYTDVRICVGCECSESVPNTKSHEEEAFASLFRNETTSSDEPSKYRALVRVRPTAQEK